MSVWGSRAAYVKHGLDGQEAALRAGAIPGVPGWGEEPRQAWGLLGARDEVHPHRTDAGDYLAFYAGVERAIRTGAEPPVLVHEAARTLRVIQAAMRSARAQAVAELTEP